MNHDEVVYDITHDLWIAITNAKYYIKLLWLVKRGFSPFEVFYDEPNYSCRLCKSETDFTEQSMRKHLTTKTHLKSQKKKNLTVDDTQTMINDLIGYISVKMTPENMEQCEELIKKFKSFDLKESE